ncbi:MAG: transcription elongation factor subunit Spt4 [Nanoarchaeota archaeon]
MGIKNKVCKDCGALTSEKECVICRSTNLADKYKGTVVIIDPNNSFIAKKLGIKKAGTYALKY